MYSIGIDLGGTNIAVGLCDRNLNMVDKGSVPTLANRPAEEIVGDMAKLSQQIIERNGFTLDDIAFRCYKEAIDETDTLKARLAMYKAFLLDDNYYNVAAVRMKGLQKKMLVKNDAENQLLFNKLKAIRRSYSEALEGKNDAIYIQALQEVKALRKNYK